MTHSMHKDLTCPACGDLDGCHMPAKIFQDRLSFEEFWGELSVWSQATFGADSVRGPEGPTKHLAKEVLVELLGMEKWKAENVLSGLPTQGACLDDVEEYADCIFLVFDACRRAGFTCEDLRVAVNRKLKVNKARKWGPPSATEPTEHVRTPEEAKA